MTEDRKYLDNGFPDRLSVVPSSPFYCKVSLTRKPRILFNGIEQPGNVQEYCVSEGWIKRQVATAKGGRAGRKALAFKAYGVVDVLKAT